LVSYTIAPRAANLTSGPTLFSARWRPSQPRPRSHQPPRRAASLTGGPAARVSQRRDDARGVIVPLSLWLTTKGRGRGGTPAAPPPPRGAARLRASGPPTRPLSRRPTYRPPPHRPGCPRNPNHPGEEPLQPLAVRRSSSGGEEERRERSRPRGSWSPRSRSRPREEPDPPGTPSSSASSSSSAPRRRLPPLHPRRPSRPAALHRRVYTSARGHLGEGIRFPSLVDAPAIAPPHRAPRPRAIAGEAGHRARLG
jgi:hypothetical protein